MSNHCLYKSNNNNTEIYILNLIYEALGQASEMPRHGVNRQGAR